MFDWLAERFWQWRVERDRHRRAWEGAARARGLYPAYCDMSGAGIAVDRGGEIWYSESPETWTNVERVAEPDVRFAALGVALARHPELAHLRPQRGPDDPVCPLCGGRGSPVQFPPRVRRSIVCQCGGLGWIPARLVSTAAGTAGAYEDHPSRPNDR